MTPPIWLFQSTSGFHSNIGRISSGKSRSADTLATTAPYCPAAIRRRRVAVSQPRQGGSGTQRLEVHVMSATEPFWSRHADFLPCNRTARFVKILRYLWNSPTQVPKSVGVNLQKIIPDMEVTLNMFDDSRRAELEAVIDRLNRRYGRTTITRGV